jgi:hypothetical protein
MSMMLKLRLLALAVLITVTPLKLSAQQSDIILALKPNALVKAVPITVVCPQVIGNSTTDISVTITKGSIRFGRQRASTAKFSKSRGLVLPDISAKPHEGLSAIEISSPTAHCKLSVSSARPEEYQFVKQNVDQFGDVIVAKGRDWMLMDLSKISASEDEIAEYEKGEHERDITSTTKSLTTKGFDAKSWGTEQIHFDPEVGETKGKSIHSKGLCARAFIPGTRYASGIVKWLNRPGPAGFSIKNEGNQFLRCPAGPYKTDYYIDGIYRRSWLFVSYKVPSHCTAYREMINGKPAFRCCCNGALTVAGYGICKNVDARTLPDWPDAGLNLCR